MLFVVKIMAKYSSFTFVLLMVYIVTNSSYRHYIGRLGEKNNYNAVGLKFNELRTRHVQQCTTIAPSDLHSTHEPEDKKPLIIDKSKKDRFVHPQVIKMFQRAQELLRAGNHTVAYKLLRRCLELNPCDSHSWLALARLEERLCNYQRSRDLFSQALEKCPNNVHILHAWGVMEERHGSEEIARECWSQVMEIEPMNPYVCHALSTLEKKLRNYDRARTILESVLRVRPTAPLCVALADIERLQGLPEDSRETLLYGLRRCRNEKSKILLALAWLEEDVFGNLTQARRWLQEAIELDGTNVRTYLAKANMELRQGRVDDARKTLHNSRSLPSEDAAHYTMLVSLELEHGNYAAAVEVAREGAKRFPNDQYLLQRWGAMEFKLGNFANARVLFERSVEIKPHAPTFVAWAILEEEESMRTISGLTRDFVAAAASVVDSSPSMTLDDTVFDFSLKTVDLPFADLSFLKSNTDTTKDDATVVKDKSSKGNKKASQGMTSGIDDDMSLTFLKSKQPDSETVKKAQMHLQRARDLFQLGLLVDPRHGPLYHAYGSMEMRQGNATGSREIFFLGIQRNSSDLSTIYHGWGLLELKEGNVNKAAEIFRTAIELCIRGSRELEHGVSFLLHSLGTLELMSMNLDEARRIFTTGIELYPKHSHLLLGLAMTYAKLGKSEEARTYFKASVDGDTKHAHAWQAWAVAEKAQGNLELARVLFRQGLKKSPSHGPLWQAFATMEFQQGNVEIARTLYAQSILRCPSHEQSYQAWACLEIRTGNFQKAKMLAARGLRVSPDHAALYTVAGVAEERLGNVDKARLILETAIKRFPSHGPLFKALGEIEARQDGYQGIERARELFRKGLERDPSCLQLYHGAALLEAKLGNIQGLSELHQEARAKFHFANSTFGLRQSHNDVLLERISQLEVSAIQNVKGSSRGLAPGGIKDTGGDASKVVDYDYMVFKEDKFGGYEYESDYDEDLEDFSNLH